MDALDPYHRVRTLYDQGELKATPDQMGLSESLSRKSTEIRKNWMIFEGIVTSWAADLRDRLDEEHWGMPDLGGSDD